MRALAGRLLCGASALGLASAAAMHTKAYPGTVPAIDSAGLTPFLNEAFKALWLADSAYLLALAAIQVLLAVRPAAASPALYALLGAIPLGVAALMMVFLGPFPPAFGLAGCGLATIIAAFCRMAPAVDRNGPSAAVRSG
jgi:hypothetical protein